MFIVYDLETTGFKTDTDDIIQLAAVKLNDNCETIDEFCMYINPHKPLPPVITEVTGITDEMLIDKPSIEEVRSKFEEFWKSEETVTFVGYNNSGFDDKFAKRLLGIKGKSVDALIIARQLVSCDEVENYKLSTICDYMGVCEEGGFHNALTDAKCTAKLFTILLKLIKSTPKVMDFVIKKTTFWKGHRGRNRVYVTTDYGTVYYDLMRGCWGNKDCEVLLPFTKLEERFEKLTNCSVRNFKGDMSFN